MSPWLSRVLSRAWRYSSCTSTAADIARLDRIGFNHICFAVDDIDRVIAKVTAAGVRLRNEMMTFHDRKLVFLEGPEGITVELAEWK